MRKIIGILAINLLLAGCASDERLAASNEPYTNLPLARPNPIEGSTPAPTGSSAPGHLIYPQGTYYPEGTP